jgi:hypothetical protein
MQRVDSITCKPSSDIVFVCEAVLLSRSTFSSTETR